MIDTNDLIEGLYFPAMQASQANTASSQAPPQSTFIFKEDLWHFRLGHLSNKRLLSLHKKFPLYNHS